MANIWHDLKEHIRWTTKKDAYVYLSLFLLLFLLSTLINDVVCIFGTGRTENTTQRFSAALLLVHAVAVYVGLLSFVYITQTAGHTTKMAGLAVGAILGNMLIFFLRVVLEGTCIQFREEQYSGK